jgi:hypothetical protein
MMVMRFEHNKQALQWWVETRIHRPEPWKNGTITVALVAQVPEGTHWEWRQGLCEHCRGTSELKPL